MNEAMNSEVEVLEHLSKTGYTSNLIYHDGKLYPDEVKGQGFAQDECVIEHEYRFEGTSNPSDMSVIYAIRLPSGTKGTVVVGYGPSADVDKAGFFRNMKDESSGN